MADNTARLKALANELINEAIENLDLQSDDGGGPKTTVMIDTGDGATCIEYDGRHVDGYGQIRCLFKPQECVIKIIEECERLFDIENKALQRKIRSGKDKEWIRRAAVLNHEMRDSRVRAMANYGTIGLLGNFIYHLNCAQIETYEDSMLMARMNLGLHFVAGRSLSRVVDFRDDIENLAATASRRRKRGVNEVIRSLSQMLVTREKQGRPPGSQTDPRKLSRRQAERQALVLQALRDLHPQEKEGIGDVARKLKKSSRTISNWAKRYEWDWEDLKSKALGKFKPI